MGRAAGNSSYYQVGAINQNGEAVGTLFNFPSVTSVLDFVTNKGPGLTGWAYNIALDGVKSLQEKGHDIANLSLEQLKTLLKEFNYSPYQQKTLAGNRGSIVHEVFELALKDGVAAGRQAAADLSPSVKGFADAALDWIEEHEPTPILIECPVISLRHRYAGTLDLLWQNKDGEVILSDLKTSKRIYDTFAIQLSAYKLALEQEAGIQVDRMTVIRVAENGKCQYKEVNADPELFLAMLKVWKMQKGEK